MRYAVWALACFSLVAALALLLARLTAEAHRVLESTAAFVSGVHWDLEAPGTQHAAQTLKILVSSGSGVSTSRRDEIRELRDLACFQAFASKRVWWWQDLQRSICVRQSMPGQEQWGDNAKRFIRRLRTLRPRPPPGTSGRAMSPPQYTHRVAVVDREFQI